MSSADRSVPDRGSIVEAGADQEPSKEEGKNDSANQDQCQDIKDKDNCLLELLCSVCAEICHRGVRLNCCNIQACRGCATKELIKNRACWSCKKVDISSNELFNDEELRRKVNQFRGMPPAEPTPKPATRPRGRPPASASTATLTVTAKPRPDNVGLGPTAAGGKQATEDPIGGDDALMDTTEEEREPAGNHLTGSAAGSEQPNPAGAESANDGSNEQDAGKISNDGQQTPATTRRGAGGGSKNTATVASTATTPGRKPRSKSRGRLPSTNEATLTTTVNGEPNDAAKMAGVEAEESNKMEVDDIEDTDSKAESVRPRSRSKSASRIAKGRKSRSGSQGSAMTVGGQSLQASGTLGPEVGDQLLTAVTNAAQEMDTAPATPTKLRGSNASSGRTTRNSSPGGLFVAAGVGQPASAVEMVKPSLAGESVATAEVIIDEDDAEITFTNIAPLVAGAAAASDAKSRASPVTTTGGKSQRQKSTAALLNNSNKVAKGRQMKENKGVAGVANNSQKKGDPTPGSKATAASGPRKLKKCQSFGGKGTSSLAVAAGNKSTTARAAAVLKGSSTVVSLDSAGAGTTTGQKSSSRPAANGTKKVGGSSGNNGQVVETPSSSKGSSKLTATVGSVPSTTNTAKIAKDLHGDAPVNLTRGRSLKSQAQLARSVTANLSQLSSTTSLTKPSQLSASEQNVATTATVKTQPTAAALTPATVATQIAAVQPSQGAAQTARASCSIAVLSSQSEPAKAFSSTFVPDNSGSTAHLHDLNSLTDSGRKLVADTAVVLPSTTPNNVQKSLRSNGLTDHCTSSLNGDGPEDNAAPGALAAVNPLSDSVGPVVGLRRNRSKSRGRLATGAGDDPPIKDDSNNNNSNLNSATTSAGGAFVSATVLSGFNANPCFPSPPLATTVASTLPSGGPGKVFVLPSTGDSGVGGQGNRTEISPCFASLSANSPPTMAVLGGAGKESAPGTKSSPFRPEPVFAGQTPSPGSVLAQSAVTASGFSQTPSGLSLQPNGLQALGFKAQSATLASMSGAPFSTANDMTMSTGPEGGLAGSRFRSSRSRGVVRLGQLTGSAATVTSSGRLSVKPSYVEDNTEEDDSDEDEDDDDYVPAQPAPSRGLSRSVGRARLKPTTTASPSKSLKVDKISLDKDTALSSAAPLSSAAVPSAVAAASASSRQPSSVTATSVPSVQAASTNTVQQSTTPAEAIIISRPVPVLHGVTPKSALRRSRRSLASEPENGAASAEPTSGWRPKDGAATTGLRRIAFSSVNIYYFNRIQGFCSVPREGGSTLGMDFQHSHSHEYPLLGDPHVKRKLFNPSLAGSSTEDVSGTGDDSSASSGDRPAKLDVFEEDEEISFKTSHVHLQSDSDFPSAIGEAATQPSSNSQVPEAVGSSRASRVSAATGGVSSGPSGSTKRRISRSISEDRIAAELAKGDSTTALSSHPLDRLNNESSSHRGLDPPRKAPKSCSLSMGPNTSSSTANLNLISYNTEKSIIPKLSEHHSSPCLARMVGQPSSMTTPVFTRGAKERQSVGKIGRGVSKSAKQEGLRRTTIKSCVDKGLMRCTRSSVEIKFPGDSKDKLPLPEKRLVQTLSKNCLRSFRSFRPEEGDQPKFEEEDDLSMLRPVRASTRSAQGSQSTSCLPSTPHRSALMEEEDGLVERRGFSSESKKKKGECGARGLTPLSVRARIGLLKSHGILNLDKTEAEEAKALRESREKCGCTCVGVCLPATCQCIQEDISCQIERPGFPCSCTELECGNPQGRRIYDSTEVQLHFVQTMMTMKGILNISGSQESLATNEDSSSDEAGAGGESSGVGVQSQNVYPAAGSSSVHELELASQQQLAPLLTTASGNKNLLPTESHQPGGVGVNGQQQQQQQEYVVQAEAAAANDGMEGVCPTIN